MAQWLEWGDLEPTLPEGYEIMDGTQQSFTTEQDAEAYVLSLQDAEGEDIDSEQGIPSTEPYYKKVIRFLTTVGEFVIAVIRYALSGLPAKPAV